MMLVHPLARELAQRRAIANTQAQLAKVGLAAPVVLGGDDRSAIAYERVIVVGRGLEPHEIPAIVRHEAGHFNNKHMQRFMQRFGVPGQFFNEQQADFVCGFTTALASDTLDPYIAFLRSAPEDSEHGTLTQRLNALAAGVNAALGFMARQASSA